MHNPTAAALLAALVAVDVPADAPFTLTFTTGSKKKPTGWLLEMGGTLPLWDAACGMTPAGETEPRYHRSAGSETWEAALVKAIRPKLESLQSLDSLRETHAAALDTLTQLVTLLETPPDAAAEAAPEMNDEVIFVPVSALKLSPGLAAVPMLGAVAQSLMGGKTQDARNVGAEIDAERAALHSSLDEIGIQEALKAHRDEAGQLWLDDGRHRLEWALLRGKSHVKVKIITAAEGAAIVEATVIGRRHWTKGQRAYLGVILHPEVAEGEKRGGNQKATKKGKPTPTLTAPALAERIGVSADTVQHAINLYTLFHAPGFDAKSPEGIEAAALKEKYEISIWAGAGLGGVLAGIGGGKKTDGQAKPESGFHNLDKPLATLTTLSKSWAKWGEGEREKALKLITARCSELDGGFRLALAEALAAAADS